MHNLRINDQRAIQEERYFLKLTCSLPCRNKRRIDYSTILKVLDQRQAEGGEEFFVSFKGMQSLIHSCCRALC